MIAALFLFAAAQATGKVIDLAPPKILDLVIPGEAGTTATVQDLQVKELGNAVQIDLAADVLFDFDKADVLPKAEDTLGKAATIIKQRAKGTVLIAGHTDSKGGDAYNIKLSLRRADAVRDWFIKKGGLARTHFETKGFGSKQPVVPNQNPDGSDDPAGRAKNRRVEIMIKT
ncbi:MAG TPA: OmpA family protein [Thermoanaerobaculia bacterium]|nr:OmpA family protein [Thermoanaerobaculia bacterium]